MRGISAPSPKTTLTPFACLWFHPTPEEPILPALRELDRINIHKEIHKIPDPAVVPGSCCSSGTPGSHGQRNPSTNISGHCPDWERGECPDPVVSTHLWWMQRSEHDTPAPVQTAQPQGRARREKSLLCLLHSPVAALPSVWMYTTHLKMLMGQLGLRGKKGIALSITLSSTELSRSWMCWEQPILPSP